MFTTTADFFNAARPCVEAFEAFTQKHNLSGSIAPDHICYKCDSVESFESIRALFEHESRYVYQSIISGRRIAIVCFKEGIQTTLGVIAYLELSDQKPDASQKEGFDHIEAYPVTMTYDELVAQLAQTETVIKVERPHHTTDDVMLPGGFLFRCTKGPLIEKIKHEEMS